MGTRFELVIGSVADVVTNVVGRAQAGECIRVVRGRKMRRLQGLFDEFAAALQFPWYFGENLDAFDECIADLSWLPTSRGYLIVVSDADQVLTDESDLLAPVVSMLTNAGDEFATSAGSHPLTFEILLHVAARDAQAAIRPWIIAGATIEGIFPA